MIWLSFDQVVSLHDELMVKNDTNEFGIRDKELLNSSIISPFQTFDGEYLYKTDEDKIIRFSYNLICDHCFIDGNKRIGFYVLIVLFKANNIKFTYDHKNITDIILDLASGKIDYFQYNELIKSMLN